MRKGGLSNRYSNRSGQQALYVAKKNQIAEISASNLKRQLDSVKSSLEAFAAKYQSKIREDVAFRAEFQSMCANIGVDPLASSKGYWSNILGFGDFYYHLGVRIIEVCMANQRKTGGLMPLQDLISELNRTKSSRETQIGEDDVVRAIKKLRCLGSGFTLIEISKLQKLVQSVPGEMNMDHTKVLCLAESRSGCVSVRHCVKSFGWSEDRGHAALNYLLQEGMAWIDDLESTRGPTYWIPSLFTAH